MTDAKPKTEFVPDDFFLLRATLLPVEVMEHLGASLRAADLHRKGAVRDEVAAAFVSDCETVRGRLAAQVASPVFQEALAVSSGSLSGNLDRWRDDPTGRRGYAVERGLVKYLVRAATRSTPYGLMAGVALGRLDPDAPTAMSLEDAAMHRRHVRTDADLVLRLAAQVATDPGARSRLRYHPNSTCYRLGDRLRLFEAESHPFAERGRLVSVAAGEVLIGLLDLARDGVHWDALVDEVVRLEPTATRAEAQEFVGEVVQAQILVPDIFPSPTGEEMIDQLDAKLSEQLPDHPAAGIVARLRRGAAVLGESPLGTGRALMEGLGAEVRAFFGEADAAAEQELDESAEVAERESAGLEGSAGGPPVGGIGCLQVDMSLGVGPLRLNPADTAPLMRALEGLHRINAQDPYQPLRDFVETFTRRYGDREVPLCEVLDPDNGIRFGSQASLQFEPSPLLSIPLGGALGGGPAGSSSFEPWLAERLVETARSGIDTLDLSLEQIRRRFPFPRALPPLSTTVLAVLALEQNGSGSREPSWELVHAGGNNCLNYLGRFAHILGDELSERLRDCARREQEATTAVLAEVSYLPPERLGNVCQQPGFRECTIPYKSPPPDHARQVVLPADLLVSVQSGRVVLRSRRDGRIVEPRIDHALNVAHVTSPSVFNFFGFLQRQGVDATLTWQWGRLGNLADLPRVRIEGTTVYPRTWNLSPEEVRGLTGSPPRSSFQHSGLDAFQRVQDWRRERGAPRLVAIGNVSDYLVADLANPLTVDLFLRQISMSMSVHEISLRDRGRLLASERGHFVNEIVMPVWNSRMREQRLEFVKQRRRDASDTPAGARAIAFEEPRQLRIADGVLQAKLYGGEAVLDKHLRGELGRGLIELAGLEGVRNWFFIRYQDPDFHLRVRFFGEPPVLASRVLPALERLCDPQRHPGLRNLVLDSYLPETVRYGGEQGVALAEEIFGIDSTTLLPLLIGHTAAHPAAAELPTVGVEGRWLLATMSVDAFLAAFEMDVAARLEFTEQYGRDLGNDYRLGVAQFKQINRLYCEARDLLDVCLGSDPADGFDWLTGCRRILAVRSERIRGWRQRLESAAAAGLLTQPVPLLQRSYIHMHCNRLFISQMRRQETMLLQLLTRHYRAALGRAKARRRAVSERKAS
ncbi:MAG: lantibiotic dehydratase [Candidatus Krumholzibacteria bacterium]|nr:lantibiotic dehydratase [Candidatus Krumholzibacteria bacterium]